MRLGLTLLPCLALAACAVGDRGLSSPHQPVVAGDHAYVPGCPDWTSAETSGAHEGQSSNYGCATNTNLAAMIADPADLLHGRGDDSHGADEATRAIKAWHEVPPSSKLWVIAPQQVPTIGGIPR